MARLSHIDDRGQARMVDVSEKDVTVRTARAAGRVMVSPETLALITEGRVPKGDVFSVARTAAIMAAKRTSELIPLCHPLILDQVTVDFSCDEAARAIDIEAAVKLSGRTGAEMEALTAVSVAALTIYDMCKAADRGIRIGNIRLIHKSGGKSGTYQAPEAT